MCTTLVILRFFTLFHLSTSLHYPGFIWIFTPLNVYKSFVNKIGSWGCKVPLYLIHLCAHADKVMLICLDLIFPQYYFIYICIHAEKKFLGNTFIRLNVELQKSQVITQTI